MDLEVEHCFAALQRGLNTCGDDVTTRLALVCGAFKLGGVGWGGDGRRFDMITVSILLPGVGGAGGAVSLYAAASLVIVAHRLPRSLGLSLLAVISKVSASETEVTTNLWPSTLPCGPEGALRLQLCPVPTLGAPVFTDVLRCL